MHLNHSPAQTTTATLPVPSTVDFAADACRPRALTRRHLDVTAFIAIDCEQTKETLKQTLLECLKDVKSKAETLRQTVVALLDVGFSSQQLCAWAKAAGRNDRYSQKLLSQIFLDLGIRRRAPGAGPRLPREGFLVESQIRDLYGEHTFKFLRAACHVAKARDEGELPVQQIPNEIPYPDQG